MVRRWISGRILSCHVGGMGLFPVPCNHRVPLLASLVAQMVKHLPAMQDIWVRSLGREDPLEKEMANQSSSLAWKIPWTEELGRLRSMGSQRVGHHWATSLIESSNSVNTVSKLTIQILKLKYCKFNSLKIKNYFVSKMLKRVIALLLRFCKIFVENLNCFTTFQVVAGIYIQMLVNKKLIWKQMI